MEFLERLADQRIQEAIERGDFNDLPGAGQPLPDEPELTGVAPELRVAYRIMKNAGMIPEYVQIRREITDLSALLEDCGLDGTVREGLDRKLRFLIQKLGESRSQNLMVQSAYFDALEKQLLR